MSEINPNEEVSTITVEGWEANPQTTVDAETYKLATTELSKVAEARIKDNLKLAELNPKSILDMDKKIQNKVIKQLYWYENLEELKLLHGENFYEKDEDTELSDYDELRKKVQLLEYQDKKGKTEIALDNFKRDNPKLFEDNKDALDKIKSELEFISDKLDPKERIERASKIIYWNYIDSTTRAFLDLQEKGWAKPNSLIVNWEINRDNPISKLFDQKFKK